MLLESNHHTRARTRGLSTKESAPISIKWVCSQTVINGARTRAANVSIGASETNGGKLKSCFALAQSPTVHPPNHSFGQRHTDPCGPRTEVIAGKHRFSTNDLPHQCTPPLCRCICHRWKGESALASPPRGRGISICRKHTLAKPLMYHFGRKSQQRCDTPLFHTFQCPWKWKMQHQHGSRDVFCTLIFFFSSLILQPLFPLPWMSLRQGTFRNPFRTRIAVLVRGKRNVIPAVC